MNFDPQSNVVSTDHSVHPVTVRNRRPLADRLGQAGAAMVIVAFGGAAMVAAMIWQQPRSAPGQMTPFPPTALVVPPPSPEHQDSAGAPPPATASTRPSSSSTLKSAQATPASDTAESEAMEAYQSGRAYAAIGRLPDAVREFQRSLLINPNSAAAHYALGMAHVRLGEMQSAAMCAATLRTLDPSLASLLENLLPRTLPSRSTVQRARR